MHKRDLLSVGSWVAIGLSCWIIAFIIAQGIPTFNNIVSLIVRSLFTLRLVGRNDMKLIGNRVRCSLVGSLVWPPFCLLYYSHLSLPFNT